MSFNKWLTCMFDQHRCCSAKYVHIFLRITGDQETKRWNCSGVYGVAREQQSSRGIGIGGTRKAENLVPPAAPYVINDDMRSSRASERSCRLRRRGIFSLDFVIGWIVEQKCPLEHLQVTMETLSLSHRGSMDCSSKWCWRPTALFVMATVYRQK